MITYIIATPKPSELLRVDLSILFPDKYVTTCSDPSERGMETCMIFDLDVDGFVEIHENIGDVLVFRFDTASTIIECNIDSNFLN